MLARIKHLSHKRPPCRRTSSASESLHDFCRSTVADASTQWVSRVIHKQEITWSVNPIELRLARPATRHSNYREQPSADRRLIGTGSQPMSRSCQQRLVVCSPRGRAHHDRRNWVSWPQCRGIASPGKAGGWSLSTKAFVETAKSTLAQSVRRAVSYDTWRTRHVR
jgi:hypothetical protein